MLAWQVQLLGELRITRGDQVITRFRTRATQLVFVYLALNLGKNVHRDLLRQTIWPNADEDSGRQSLRTALSDIRSKLGPNVLRADHTMVCLDPKLVDTDLTRFQRSRSPSDCPARLLPELNEDWIVPFALDLDDTFAHSVMEQMPLVALEDARALASECLRRDPSRLDVRAKMRELGLVTSINATPVSTTPFVGRERELKQIQDLLLNHRIVTLTGFGGSGKTRIAGQIWRYLQPESWFVPLSDIGEADQVAEAIRSRLNLPSSVHRSALAQVAFALQGSSGVLVLDNFEHVLTARNAVDQLRRECPRLRLLITSQIPLGLDEEIEFPIGPLDLTARTRSAVSDGALLFEERARSVVPDFSISESNLPVVEELCRKLDGLPLAIEIAAAKSRVFSPSEMLSELEDRFGFLVKSAKLEGTRHGSLRTALDWSFERLSDAEQTLLTDLTVFRGGFTLEAARDVCGGPALEDNLQGLLASAWIERIANPTEAVDDQPTRFRLLESIHEYASELVAPRRRAELGKEHATHFLEVARQCFVGTFQQEEETMHRQIEVEMHNFDAAWAWLRLNDPEANLEFLTWSNWFYVLKGRSWLLEARLREALDHVDDSPRDVYCFALHVMGDLQIFQSRFREAEGWLIQSADMAQDIGADLYRALSLIQLAWVKAELGEFARARACAEEALSLQLGIGNLNWIASCHCVSALIANREGKWEEAIERGESSEGLYRLGGYRWGLASALNEIAYAQRNSGQLEAALKLELESIEIKKALNVPRSLAVSLAGLTETYYALGDVNQAKAALQECVKILRDIGDLRSMTALYWIGEQIAREVGDLECVRLTQLVRQQLVEAPLEVGAVRRSLVSSTAGPDSGPSNRLVNDVVQALLSL